MRKWLTVIALAAVAGCGFDSGGGNDGNGNGNGDDPGPGNGDDPYQPPFGACSGADSAQDDPPPDTADCFGSESDPDEPPLLVIEHEFVQYEGVDAVHIMLTFNPTFVDNTYGANAIGWERDHKFKDLVGSDHADVTLTDGNGEMVFDLTLDYISEDPDAPCGYSSLGVFGGEGKIRTGDPDAILGWTSSLDRNLNERGYCFTEDSPATDAACTPNSEAPDWDYRVVYEMWVALSAFDPAGFGAASMTAVHASPAKGGENTVTVTPGDCSCIPIDPGDCEDNPPDGGDECVDDGDCGPGEFCEGGHCSVIIG